MPTSLRGWMPWSIWRTPRWLSSPARTGCDAVPIGTGSTKPPGIDYPLGAFRLCLPRDHALPRHRRRWPLYDTPLQLVASALREQVAYPCGVDIGANVGDTAAVLNLEGPFRTLCIEGDPAYLPYLRWNARQFGAHVAIESCFVGTHSGTVELASLQRQAGTTQFDARHVAQESSPAQLFPQPRGLDGTSSTLPLLPPGSTRVERLESILQRHPSFAAPDLLKTDADGQDFPLLLGHLDWIARQKPVLFFEHDVQLHPSGMTLSCQFVDALNGLGYGPFVIFDNFGHLLLVTGEPAIFQDLNRYLRSHAQLGRAVHYWDVCAIPPHRAPLAERIRTLAAARLS